MHQSTFLFFFEVDWFCYWDCWNVSFSYISVIYWYQRIMVHNNNSNIGHRLMHIRYNTCCCTWRHYTDFRYSCDVISDPRTKDWLFMPSPILQTAIILFYIFFVTLLGPRIMENRKPFNLKPVLVIYNFSVVALSLYMCYEVNIIIFAGRQTCCVFWLRVYKDTFFDEHVLLESIELYCQFNLFHAVHTYS